MAYGKKSMYRRPYKRTYNRRYRKKRYPNVKTTSYFTPRNVYSAARYAARGYNLLKGIVNAEVKRYDGTVSQNISNAYTMSLLSAVDQGDDVQNRNGNSILAKYFTLSYNLTMNASATGTFFRMIIFADGDSDSTNPVDTDLLQNNATGITSPINSDNTQRFTVLYDNVHCLSINGDRVVNEKIYRPLHFHIRYRTGTASTGHSKNNIWAFLLSNEATNTPLLTFDFRLAFYDN